MDSSAKVRSVDAIEQFKAALAEFGEVGLRALSEAESDIQRTIWWLKNDQTFHWRRQKKKRAEKLSQAKSELFRAQLSADQDNRSTTLERRAVEKAEQGLEESEWKLERITYWVRLLEREMILYQGQAQSLSTALAAEVPHAAAKLENMIRIIEEYLHLAPPSPAKPPGGGAESPESAAMAPLPSRPAIPKIRELRDAAPRQSRRDAAEVQSLQFHTGQVDDRLIDLRLFAVPPPAAPMATDRVVFEESALDSPRFFLERSQTVAPGDSGWYIGIAGSAGDVDSNPSVHATTIGDLLRLRPDLAMLLGLPRGHAVVVANGAVEAIWNNRNKPVDRLTTGTESTEKGAS